MGIEIVMSIFAAALHRCDLNEGRQYTAEAFERSLAPLKDCDIGLPGGGSIRLTWRRGPFGSFTNRAGKALIRKQLANYLIRADQPVTEGNSEPASS